MKINKEQKIIFLIGLLVIIFISALHQFYPYDVFWMHVILVILLWFFALFVSRTKKPLDDSIKYKPKAISLIERGICPFCEKNSLSEYRIRIGYTKARFWMGYYVFWIKYSYWKDEFTTSVPLCTHCKDKFLHRKLLNPSFTILENKRGFSKGLKNPYEKYHIFIPESD